MTTILLWYRIRLITANLQKRWRLSRISRKPYIKRLIQKATFESIKHDEMFLTMVQLGRICNTLVSANRTFLGLWDNGRLIRVKDRLEMLLTMSSFVYEAVLEIGRLSGDLKKLSAWNLRKEDIDFLNKERGDANSVYQTVLRDIRNTIIFHFEKDAIDDAVANYSSRGGSVRSCR